MYRSPSVLPCSLLSMWLHKEWDCLSWSRCWGFWTVVRGTGIENKTITTLHDCICNSLMLSASRKHGGMQLLLHFTIDEDLKRKQNILSGHRKLSQFLSPNVSFIRTGEKLGPLHSMLPQNLSFSTNTQKKVVRRDRTRGNILKFQLDWKTENVIRHRNKLPRQVVGLLYLEVFKRCIDVVLGMWCSREYGVLD